MTAKFVAALALSILALVHLSLTKPAINANNMVGAWGYGQPQDKTVMITTDKVFSVARYDVPGKKLIHSFGGTWRIDGNKMVKTIEWDSKDSSRVGNEISEDIQLSNNRLIIKQTNETWNRLDDGTPGALKGAWIITGNFRDDKAVKRNNPFYPRRTMKILSGKYFHWIAYHLANKTFENAGGGPYTTQNGKYTENIEFFTKKAESIGKTLVFDYSFVDGDWRHKGEKSTGGSMDECWSRRETLEK